MSKANKLPIEEKIIEKNITQIFHDSMMPYAEHVILDRVIPKV